MSSSASAFSVLPHTSVSVSNKGAVRSMAALLLRNYEAVEGWLMLNMVHDCLTSWMMVQPNARETWPTVPLVSEDLGLYKTSSVMPLLRNTCCPREPKTIQKQTWFRRAARPE